MQLVMCDDIAQQKESMAKGWRRGARFLNRQLASMSIRKSLRTHVREEGSRTIKQIRALVSKDVGRDLETGKPRIYFEKRLQMHMAKLKRKKKSQQEVKRARRAAVRPSFGDSFMRKHGGIIASKVLAREWACVESGSRPVRVL
jgi:hypothetical protein